MKKLSNIIWGVLLLAIGIVFALNQLDVTDINLFFDGWWTFLIIIPFTVSLITERKLGNLIGIGIGVVLLLACRDIISFELVGKLIVPAIIIIIGAKLIINSITGDKARKIFEKRDKDGSDVGGETCFAAFSGNEIDFTSRKFEAAELCAIFGGVECDLSGAIIDGDCAVKATAVFGGVDITVPSNINVKITSTSIFGGVGKKYESNPTAPITLHINAVCIFGGVDIK